MGDTPQANYPEPCEALGRDLSDLAEIAELIKMSPIIRLEQEIEGVEIITDWETLNKYLLKDSSGQVLLRLHEKSSAAGVWCCHANRAFKVEVMNPQCTRKLMVMRRNKACVCCCLVCCNFARLFQVDYENGKKNGKEHEVSIISQSYIFY